MARRLLTGVLPVLACAVADYLAGLRSAASLDALDPNWGAVADVLVPPTVSGLMGDLAPLAYWRLEDGAGLTAAEESGTYPAALDAGLTWVASLQADGAGALRSSVNAEAAYWNPPAGTGALSLLGWVRTDGACTLLGVEFGDLLKVSVLAGGQAYAYADGDGVTTWGEFVGPVVNDNLPHFLAAVFDGVDNVLYVDGVEAGRFAGALPTRVGGATAGRLCYCQTATYVEVDEVAVVPRVVTAAEVAALYSAGS